MFKKLEWEGVELQLLPSRLLYIPAYQLMVLSDWHLGKLGHFRKEGLFVPPMALKEELGRLGHYIQLFFVKKVVFLGDLFHSSWNYEWDEFLAYIDQFPAVEFILTKGNHDILSPTFFDRGHLDVVDLLYVGDNLLLSHQAVLNIPPDVLNIVGHVHPGVEIVLRGRQRYRLSCFYFQDNILTLPAFGKWTGLHLIKKTLYNRVFAVIGNEVMEV